MTRPRGDAGVSMIELLVAIAVFAVVSTSMYSVLFAVQRGANDARSVAAVSEEARLGFNRMVRDTREGMELTAAEPDSFTFQVDFENDGLGPQSVTFSKAGDEIRLNGETLIDGVDCIREGGSCVQDVFHYTSNQLAYDWDANGVTTWEELDASSAPAHGVVGVGNNDGDLNIELAYVTDVTFAIEIQNGGSSGEMIASAQLRNRR